MSTRTPPSRAVATLVGGAATVLYYATPDFIASRTARGWAKAGLAAVSVAVSAPDLREAWETTARERQELDGEGLPAPTLGSLPTRSKAVIGGSVATVLAGSVAGLLAAERWVFRRGEARAAAGKRLPHTGPALLYGAISSALWLLPTPSEDSAPKRVRR